MTRKFYITTPIYYVNGAPHIGHAYTSVAADALARFKRLDGFDVHFLTGTDEHGQKVEATARANNIAPQEFTDRIAGEFRAMAQAMNISNDDFIRTTEPRHIRSCQAIWQAIERAGAIELGHYEGWYAVRDEAFYDESELVTGADGVKRSPFGAPVEWVREPSYFFKLSMFQDRLLKLYEDNPDFIQPASSRNEVLSFVRSGLRDISISRTSFKWGIPVPGAPDHVMYVWIDALTNYLTACGYPDMDAPLMKYWPADLHLVGKEITRFHAVYWPAMLMAAGLPVPRRIFANGWWTIEGEKMSKSLNNALAVEPLIAEFGLDQLRFCLLREMPFGNDGNFSRRSVITRINVELANDLGNLAQRTLAQVARNLGGCCPARTPATEEDAALLAAGAALPATLRERLDRQALHEALEDVWKVIRAANVYIDRQAPWALRRTDPPRMAAVLRVLVDVLRDVATVLQPFMPASMARLLDQLGVPTEARDLASLATPLTDGTALPPPQGIFPRYADPVA